MYDAGLIVHFNSQAVEAMNQDMQIPSSVQELSASDVQEVAVRAMKEAHGNVYNFFSVGTARTLV